MSSSIDVLWIIYTFYHEYGLFYIGIAAALLDNADDDLSERYSLFLAVIQDYRYGRTVCV